MEVSIREIVDPADPAIAAFGRLQEAVYYAPETLIPAAFIPRLLGDRSPGRHNFLLVAESGGRVIAGTLFHYFAEPNTGFSSFLGVARDARRQGLSRRLHEARFAALDRVAGRPVLGVFIDVTNPGRMPAADRERERAVGSDPAVRRAAFARLGFRQVDIRYEQPVGGPGGGPVTTLDLLFCPRTPRPTVPTRLVGATLRAYWRSWLGEAAATRFARELEGRADGREELALLDPR
jgi:GNAT superfamily N-acetyltransferase